MLVSMDIWEWMVSVGGRTFPIASLDVSESVLGQERRAYNDRSKNMITPPSRKRPPACQFFFC